MTKAIQYIDKLLLEAESENRTKIFELFEPLFKLHADEITNYLTEQYNNYRKRFVTKFPKSELDKQEEKLKYIHRMGLITKYPNDKKEILDYYENYDKRSNYYDRKTEEIHKQFKSKFYFDDTYGWEDLYRVFGIGIYDDKRYQIILNKIIADTIEANKWKLSSAIKENFQGLEVKSVETISSRISMQGIQGTFKITLTNGVVGQMNTQSVPAGGYNIQRFHYRYLIQVSDNLKENVGEVEEQLSNEQLRVAQTIASFLPDTFESTPNNYNKEGMRLSKDAVRAVEELKGGSRNWSYFHKQGYTFDMVPRQTYGMSYATIHKGYTEKFFVTKKGFEFFKKYKGQQIFAEPDDVKLTANQKRIFDTFMSIYNISDAWTDDYNKGELDKEHMKKYEAYKGFIDKFDLPKGAKISQIREIIKSKVAKNEINKTTFDSIKDYVVKEYYYSSIR